MSPIETRIFITINKTRSKVFIRQGRTCLPAGRESRMDYTIGKLNIKGVFYGAGVGERLG